MKKNLPEIAFTMKIPKQLCRILLLIILFDGLKYIFFSTQIILILSCFSHLRLYLLEKYLLSWCWQIV